MMCSHELLAWAVQVQPVWVETDTLPLPAPAPTLAKVGLSVYVQPPPQLPSLSTVTWWVMVPPPLTCRVTVWVPAWAYL